MKSQFILRKRSSDGFQVILIVARFSTVKTSSSLSRRQRKLNQLKTDEGAREKLTRNRTFSSPILPFRSSSSLIAGSKTDNLLFACNKNTVENRREE